MRRKKYSDAMCNMIVLGLCMTGAATIGTCSATTVLQAEGKMAPCIGTDVKAPPGQDAEFTMEAWIKPSNNYGGHWICCQGGNGAGTFMLRTYHYKLSVEIAKYVGKGLTDAFNGMSDTSITLDTWQHVACVRTPTEIRLYINGARDKTLYATDAPGNPEKFPNINDSNLQTFMIGGLYGTSFDTYAGNNSWTYKGRMAEVRLWSVARTDEEIAANCSNRLCGAETGLIGYWPMSGSAGRTFKNHVTGVPAVVPAATYEADGATATNFTVVTDETLPLATPTERMTRGICFCWNTNETQKANLSNLSSFAGGYNYAREGEDFTYEAWIKLDPALTNATGWTATELGTGIGLFQQYRSGTVGRMLARIFDKGRINVFWASAGGAANYIATPNPLPVDKWVHLAVVLGHDGQLICVDGEPVAHATNPYNGLSQPEATNTPNGYNQMFGHYMAYACLREVRVWRRARTETEIREQYLCKLTGKERYLIYYNPCSQKTPGTDGWYWFSYVKDSPWEYENPAVTYGASLGPPSAFLHDTVPALEAPVDKGTSFATFNGTKFTYIRTGKNITTADFTVEAWIYPRQFKSTGNYVFSQYDYNKEGRMQLTLPGGKPAMSIVSTDASLGTSGEISCSGALPTNVWTHIAAVREGGTWTIYTNGLVAVSATGRSTCALYSGGQFCIGLAGVAETSAFNGCIRDARAWKRARTQDEIATYMHNTLNGRHPALVGYWPLDTDTGNDCVDAKAGTVGTMNVGWAPAATLALGEAMLGSPVSTLIVFR